MALLHCIFYGLQLTHFVGDLQHVVVKHSSWFVKQYGSLAVWTQGMEKSHYQAKTAFHKHTQHSRTAKHHSAIVQTFEWWYRVMQHKQYKIEKDEVLSTANAAAQAVKDARRQSFLSSTAAAKHVAWRATRKREGSHWAPEISTLGESQIEF